MLALTNSKNALAEKFFTANLLPFQRGLAVPYLLHTSWLLKGKSVLDKWKLAVWTHLAWLLWACAYSPEGLCESDVSLGVTMKQACGWRCVSCWEQQQGPGSFWEKQILAFKNASKVLWSICLSSARCAEHREQYYREVWKFPCCLLEMFITEQVGKLLWIAFHFNSGAEWVWNK